MLITGPGTVTVDVVKVEVGDVVDRPPVLTELTAKVYVVPPVKPISVTEWDVTNVPSTVDCKPMAGVGP